MLEKLVAIYHIIRHFINPVKFPKEGNEKWKEVKEKDVNEFSTWVNSFEYKSDRLWGLIDWTPPFEHFIDRTVTHSRDCIPKYETVYANGGYIKKVGDLKVGDTILSYNFKEQRSEYKKILNIWDSGKKEVFEIKFLNGKKSHSSINHKFFGYNKEKSKEYSPIPLKDFLDRTKNDISHSWKKKVPVVLDVPYEDFYGFNNLSETSIKSITSLEKKEDMLDLEVEDNHNFFLESSGSLVHNCDAWSRMWLLWGLSNDYKGYEVIVGNNGFPMKAHMITILEKNGRYYLCDYQIYGIFENEEQCKKRLCEKWDDYTIDNLIWSPNYIQKRAYM